MSVLGDVNYKARQEQIPFSVHFDLTYRCHQSCVHCYLPKAWRKGEKAERELDTRQVKGILDQLAAAGTFFLALSGGEVFLRPDLFTILAYARKLNFSISLMSSGTYGLTEECLRFLKDLGLHGLLMTLFSMDRAVHDRITRDPGSWSRLQRTIRAAKALGLPVVLNVMVLSLNWPGIMAAKEFGEAEDIPMRVDSHLSPRWDGQPHLDGLALTAEVRRHAAEILGLDGLDQAGVEKVTVPWKERGCGAGESQCYLTPQGEMWPCVDVRWPCGHIEGPEDFHSLWNSAPLARARQMRSKCDAVGERFCEVYQNQIRGD